MNFGSICSGIEAARVLFVIKDKYNAYAHPWASAEEGAENLSVKCALAIAQQRIYDIAF